MAGLLQNEDFKTEAEIIGLGGTKDQLPNDTKVYITSTTETLAEAFVSGSLARPQVFNTFGAPQVVTTQILLPSFVKPDGVVFVVGSGPVSINVADIAAGSFVGQRLKIWGTSDTNTVTIADLSGGLIVLALNILVDVIWNGTTWIEAGRSN